MPDVVLPCLDEALALPWVLERMPPGYRALVCDNGSTDGSAEVAAGFGVPVLAVPQRGFGAACADGVEEWARWHATHPGEPDDGVVCFLDADATLDPHELPRLAAPVLAGEADLVLGRRVPVEKGAWPVHARLGNAELARRLRRRTGVDLHDLGPMRACRREALRGLGVADRRFGYPLEMVTRAADARWVIREVPVDYRLRAAGSVSKVTGSWRGTFRAVRDMGRVLSR